MGGETCRLPPPCLPHAHFTSRHPAGSPHLAGVQVGPGLSGHPEESAGLDVHLGVRRQRQQRPPLLAAQVVAPGKAKLRCVCGWGGGRVDGLRSRGRHGPCGHAHKASSPQPGGPQGDPAPAPRASRTWSRMTLVPGWAWMRAWMSGMCPGRPLKGMKATGRPSCPARSYRALPSCRGGEGRWRAGSGARGQREGQEDQGRLGLRSPLGAMGTPPTTHTNAHTWLSMRCPSGHR